MVGSTTNIASDRVTSTVSITINAITTKPAPQTRSMRLQPIVSPRRWVSLVMRDRM